MKHKANFQLAHFFISIFYFIIILSVFFACKSGEIIPQKITEKQQQSESDNYFIQEKISIIPNQTLSVEKNEWGQNYLKTLPGHHIIIKYSYIQIPKDTGLQDARYTENVWVEIHDKSLKNNDFDSIYFKKNPLYVQIYGFRNAQLIPVSNAEMHLKLLDKQTLQIIIDMHSTNMLIRQKNIKQTVKFESK